MKRPNGFLHPNPPEVSPSSLSKGDWHYHFHLRFTSITGQVPMSPPHGLLLNQSCPMASSRARLLTAAELRAGARAWEWPRGAAGFCAARRSRAVTRVSLGPAALRPPPRRPEGVLGLQRGRPFKLASVRPSGFPAPLQGYLGAEPWKGSVSRRPASV